MNESIKPTEIIFSQFEYAFSVIDKCTDDYIFIYDLINDNYTISDSAVKRFPLPSSKFENVSEALKNVIHPDDYNMIVDNIKGLINGTETKHNFEYRWKNLENDYIWISCHGQLVLDHNNKPAYLAGRISEIGSLKRADNLTGLLTDIQLTKDYNSYISKFGNIQGYLMRIEVVNLKHLCRRYGKSVGNYVLHILAKILESAVTNKARPYKYESSSFLIFDYSRGTVEDAKLTFENIRRAISKACEDLDYKIFFTVSAGIVEINSNVATEIEDLYKKAEFSIYHIQKKENNIAVFDEEEYNTYIRKLQIQENLRKSINNNFEGFELYYQPIISPESKKIVGAESLLRWKSKDFGAMAPVEFVPILEESGLIVPLGKWIFKTAITQCKEWQKYIPNFKININVSHIQLKSSDVLSDVLNFIDKTDLDPKYVVIEVTESGHLEMDNNFIKDFQSNNFKLAIDDFGTGYSNIRYLNHLNVHTLKIDRSFVSRATNSIYDYNIIKYIVDMAHSIGIEVCLEGVETDEELNVLLPLNPDYIQGYYFGKPVPKEAFFDLHIKNNL